MSEQKSSQNDLIKEEVAPIVMLAPMAGITDLPFRNLVMEFGGDFVVSEMIASREMLCKRPGTKERTALGLNANRTIVQIAGCEGEPMAEVACMLEAEGAHALDINMGCPAKKVTQGASGSALMRNPNHALSLIEAVTDAVRIPVSVKMRLGWDESSLNAAEIAQRAESAGISRVVVHGRTRQQFYKGSADWDAIAKISQVVDIPVIANGDICSHADAQTALSRSEAQGVMIGRAARGKPWLIGQIKRAFNTEENAPSAINPELTSLISKHFEAILDFYGIPLGSRIARKHLSWYAEAAGFGAPERQRLVANASPAEILREIHSIFEGVDANTAPIIRHAA